MRKNFFCKILEVFEDFSTDPHPDPLIRGTDPIIRIHIRIRATDPDVKKYEKNIFFCKILKVFEDFSTDPHPDPLIRGTDPIIRIHIGRHCNESR